MSFPTYPAYKNSGVKWLSDVPRHWDVRRNKQVFRLVSVQVGNKSADFQLLSLTLRGVIPRDMESGKGKFPAEFDTYQVVEPDDIVFCLFDIDETPRTVGISSDFGMITGAYTVAKTLPAADPRFIYYYYFSIDLRKGLRPFYTGLRKVVRPETFLNIELPLPPLSEQANICNFLDHETARIDALIEEQQRLIELLKEKRQAVISHAVTKGLDPTVPMKDSGVEWLGEVPAHWEVSKFGYISTVVRGGSPRPAGDPELFNGDYSPWVTVAEITKDDEIYLTETETFLTKKGSDQCRVFAKGTLLLSNSGATLGVPKILEIDANANDGVVGFERLTLNREYSYFYLTTLTNSLRERIKQGSGQPNLNTDIVKSIDVPIPPANEEAKILASVKKTREIFKLLSEEAERGINLLQERRSALISAAVTGRIDVRGWQPPVSTPAPESAVAEAV